MKYMGSKAKYAKYILPLILKDRKEGQWYVEPFVGGANIIDKVDGNRIGSDINYYLIEMFKAVQAGWEPPTNIDEQEYNHIRNNQDKIEPQLVAFVGIGCSYSGKWFGGFARGNNNKDEPRNYCLESKNSLLKQNLNEIIFKHCNYFDLEIPYNSIIYADKPYENTTQYKNKFDHNKFWVWAKEMALNNHTIFVSEYNAPPDWECIWEKEVFSSLTKNTGAKSSTEKLFRYKG